MFPNVDIAFPSPDIQIEQVADELTGFHDAEHRWSTVIRRTYDSIYNGQQTGRYKWSQLMKTEKTHFGTLFEINAQREFGFLDGDATDFTIAGCEVDAKWSQSMGGWMLPPEVFDRVALVATGDDRDSVWSLGLVRVSEVNRRAKGNRDQKSSLSQRGRESVRWIWKDAPLRPNVLLQMPDAAVAKIFSHSSGQRRVDELFRQAEGCVIHRNAVDTVAMQLDSQKRVRYNGGARGNLAQEGYVILSGKYHSSIAEELGLQNILNDEYCSIRLVEVDCTSGVEIDRRFWRVARANESVNAAAPKIY